MTGHDQGRVTLSDVATRAGVSASTASIAFSGTGPVSRATRDRVLAAAKALNYAGPDPRARSLRRGRSGVIGAVVEDRLRDAFRDPIMITMLDGIADEIGSADAALLLLADAGPSRHSPNPGGAKAFQGEGASRHAVTIEDAPIDGAVLISCSTRLDESIDRLRSRGIPVVAIEGDPVGIPIIALDNRDATARGARHLHELGHRRVAIVTLPLDRAHSRGEVTDELLAIATSDTALQRLIGARDVFPDAPAVATTGSELDEGLRAGRRLLAAPAGERPTAIIAHSDLLAAGVIRAAEELGIAVPEQLSVLGFDGARVDGLWPYDLTTLEQPAFEKGQAAGRAILRMLEGETAESAEFTSVFHRGNTTAPPPTD